MKFYFLLFTVACMACTQKSETSQLDSKEKSLDSLLNAYHEGRLKLNPLDATAAGDNRYNAILINDLTAAHRDSVTTFYNTYKNALTAIDKSTLSTNDQMSYEILLWECDRRLENLAYKTYLTPVNQFTCLPLTMGQLGSGSSYQPFKTTQDYDNWLNRLDTYVVWIDTAIANMRVGMKSGYVLPKALAEKMIPQYTDMGKLPATENLFYGPINNFPEKFSDEEKARYTKEYTAFITDKIVPQHLKLRDFIKKEYLPACRTTAGISALPNGNDFYAYSIKEYTTTNMTAKEIFDLGQKEVERITKEMQAVKDEVGYKGDIKSFFASLRTKKELMPYSTPEQVLDHFREIHERMKPNLNKLFDRKPKTPFEIRRTEEFREASASAEYNPGSIDGTRPGVFYVPIPNAKTYNVLSDEDLFLHEAIPGHHYQISIQQENDSLPEFRKLLWYSAYGEGWALYTESLGKELGLYTDPYQYFGMLSAEMHRAIRLVVDAGIHTQGWTREQAIQYSLDHEAESEEGITAEIERYMSWPGQALSYKIGQLKIRELRARAEEKLADKFNIGAFHTQVLEAGCLPLSVLETKIDKWIDASAK